jgi:hypothetical protein
MAVSKKTTKKSTQKSIHIIFKGNHSVVLATREAIGAMKYKGQ